MLEETLARKLIEHVTKCTTYNVNIMNEKGIIIMLNSQTLVLFTKQHIRFFTL